jgi:hypothetical protein
MASEREERIAQNEALFRIANERMAEWNERERGEALESYFCECASPECTAKVQVSVADYERVRSVPAHFILCPGHEIPDVETVVEEHDGWTVIEKDPNVRDIYEGTDPRRD